MKFYKRDPDRALSGMAEMTLEQRGAYNSILDLLYSRDGDVPDDDRRVARMITCHWREYARVKSELIALGKVWVEGGKLRAKRVQETIKEASDFAQDQSKRAADGWQKRKSSNKINEHSLPPGNALTPTPTPTPSRQAGKGAAELVSEAIGFDITATEDGGLFLSQAIAFMREGIDLELDLVPTIKRMRSEGRIPSPLRKGLNYFRQSALDHKLARVLMADAAVCRTESLGEPISEQEWRGQLKKFVRHGFWPAAQRFGAPPTEDGCKAPAGLLEASKAAWNAQGQMPEEHVMGLIKNPTPFWGDNVVAMPRRSA